MARNGFYNDNDDSIDEDDAETDAYAYDPRQIEERRSRSRSRSRDRSRERGRERGRRRDGGRAHNRGEDEGGRSRPRSAVTIVSPSGSAPDVRTSSGDSNSLPSENELAERVAASVTATLTSKLADILAQKENSSDSMVKEVEALRAAQKHSSLLNEATELQSESAQKQFIAFAKVKNGISNARRLVALT